MTGATAGADRATTGAAGRDVRADPRSLGQALRDMPTIAKLPPAIVTSVSESGVTTLSKTGESIFLSWEGDLSRSRLSIR